MKKINNLEVETNNIISEWNKINHYNIEEILKALGYKFNQYIIHSDLIIKSYINSDESIGYLYLSDEIVPVFMNVKNGKCKSIVIFKKKIQVSEFISIPDKDLGVIEYGIDLEHPDYMQFFSESKKQYKYSVKRIERKKVMPDEIKYVENKEPVSLINNVYLWASEIRRELAPKNNIIVKK